MNDQIQSKSDAEPSLQMGLAALERKDYPIAIAHLEAVCQVVTHRSTLLKAQMGLVKAYERTGRAKLAIDLCRSLSQSQIQQVQQWAEATIAKLMQHHPEFARPEAVEISTADTDIANTDIADTDIAGTNIADTTGFVPLTDVIPPTVPEQVKPQWAKPGRFWNAAGDRPSATALPEESLVDPSPEDLLPGETGSPLEPEFENPFLLSDGDLIVSDRALPYAPPQQPARPQTAAAQPDLSANHSPHPPEWKQAGRAQKWATLGANQLESLWALMIGTTIALFWIVQAILWTAMSGLNNWLAQTMYPIDLREYAVFYKKPFWIVVLPLFALFWLAPWLLDRLLRCHRLQPLPTAILAKHSPEANRVLKRVCSQKRLPFPTLAILPTATPLAMSYGCLPHNARIVLSQGLLDQLDDDEIAAIVAAELGHIVRWDFAVISLVTLVTQIPYFTYWQVSAWGDRRSFTLLRSIAAVVAAVAYGLYWLCRWAGLWLSRVRLYYSDRFACEVTGNPNGLTRALLKMTLGTAVAIQQQGHTSVLLEGFELFSPIGHRAALSLGSVLPYLSPAQALAWEQHHPARRWLTLNNTHPLLGDRLYLLTLYARHWRLEPELELSPPKPARSGLGRILPPTRSLWLQGAPWFGVAAGLSIALLLWGVGTIAAWMDWTSLSWMRSDRGTLWGFLLLGFSFGTFLRINAFFPDIRFSATQIAPFLPTLLSDTALLPTSSQPIQLQGKLLGRRGISNWLVQDLLLQTAAGCIKLHYLSQMGAAGNLLLHPHRPDALINRPVTVIGWWRRGATPWIDVDRIQLRQGATIRSGHPVWSTVAAGVAAAWGAFLIASGSL